MRQRWILAVLLLVFLPAVTACGNDKEAYIETLLDTETEQAAEAELEQSAQTEEERHAYVYVCGAVKQPGVYVLKASARIYEAIEAAGGLTEEANAASVNQAEPVEDGQMIRILTKDEADVSESEAAVVQDGRIDLNAASAEQLMTLPGIGSAKAESIISYREKNGGFSSVEEIMQVEGIKEGVFNRIKDSIKVK